MISLKNNPIYQRLLKNLSKPDIDKDSNVRFVKPRFPTEEDLNFHTTMRLHEKIDNSGVERDCNS